MSCEPIKMPKRFDYTVSGEFNAALLSCLAESTTANRKITLDCALLEYIDSAGIGILVMAHKKAQNANAELVINNMKSSAKEILLLANMQKLIEIH